MACFKTAAILLASSSTGHGFLGSRNPAAITAARHQLPSSSFPVAATNVNGSTEAVDAAEAAIDASPSPIDEPINEASHNVSVPPPLVDVTTTQNSLLRIAASSDRGQYATSQQKETVSRLLSDLESTYQPSHTTTTTANDDDGIIIPPQLTGTWTLLYSNTQLFRSSPFFLAGRSTCKTTREAEQFAWFCDMHRAALSISNIGTVRQIISGEGRLVNEFEVKAGAIPFLSDFVRPWRYSGGLPLTIDGAIVSSADVTPKDGGGGGVEWEIYMDTVEIRGSNIPILRSILDRDESKLKSRDLSKLLEENVESYETPRPVLRTTYVDEGMRIVRDEDDNVFVYGKVSDSQEPTDYSGVLSDLGVASLLEGFNDAVTKFYL
ncbi:hypothetical protein HJC23_012071 [Cyclotella cryptica]|uniref:Plastid lipid-associated protein/fibrillin conserved domain-containing protein n=1 Tax=Cyclotella cryptica TaxID=29204 RepID=A0ABD3PUN4_9STRA|eukprot:CCRYP_011663-RA/>CCRYP_011663-RA protein AED:0.43 eAED:0.43 QI:0/-1/0/1/-1/1/1/0/378